MGLDLQPEVFVGAYGAYAMIVGAVVLRNARERRVSGRLDEAGPGRHVFHEGRAKALIGQILGRDG